MCLSASGKPTKQLTWIKRSPSQCNNDLATGTLCSYVRWTRMPSSSRACAIVSLMMWYKHTSFCSTVSKKRASNQENHILDNRISADLKQAIQEEELTYKLVPKGQHCRNITNNFIGTRKSTAVGGILQYGFQVPHVLMGPHAPAS